MKQLRIILVALLITFSVNSNATSVMGAPSCGEWLKDKTAEKRGFSWESMADHKWLVGYISGYAAGSELDVLKNKPDKESLYLWMDNYCFSHPLNDITEGTEKLIDELQKNKH